MPSKYHHAVRYQNGQISSGDEALLVEQALELFIDNQPFTVTMRTPGKDIELAMGLLLTEGIILPEGPIPTPQVSLQPQSTTIHLLFPKGFYPNIGKRSMVSVSSCGVCGKQDLEDIGLETHKIQKSGQVAFDDIRQWFTQMNAYQTDFIQTGGAHAAAAFSESGELLSIMEDIGRHNAVDKVIGDLLLRDRLDDAFALTVSGRISFEIVSKASIANIPVLAAVSAVSGMAAEYAEANNLTLLGFCRNDKATCYANSYRLAVRANNHSSQTMLIHPSKNK